MKYTQFYQVLFLVVILTSSCKSSSIENGRVILPQKILESITWSEQDLKKEIAVQHLIRTNNSSTHVIRLNGNEKPHYHDHHDLTVTVLSGEGVMHFKDRQISTRPGDVIHIPSGTFHWAAKAGSADHVVFAEFSPPFDGKDRRFINSAD